MDAQEAAFGLPLTWEVNTKKGGRDTRGHGGRNEDANRGKIKFPYTALESCLWKIKNM